MIKVMITTTVAVLVLISITFSQELSRLSVVGEAIQVEDGLVGAEHRDANGRICAGIMIVSDMEGFTYQSNNGIVDVDNNPGQDVVFVSPDERVLEVYHSGYEPLKIILSEYGVKLESQRIWKFKITGDKKLTEIPVTIIVKPENVKILIDGRDAGDGRSVKVAIGQHELEISKDGYKTTETEIGVSESQTFFEYQLEKIKLQMVTIRSDPQGAQIFIDDIEIGRTDKQIFRYPGKYRLRLVKNKYETISEEINVVDDESNDFTYPLFKTTAILTLVIEPADAQAYINGETVTGSSIEVSPGTHQLEAKKEGYFPESRVITITKGKNQTELMTLRQKTGGLQVTIEPMETQSILKRDGKEIDRWAGSKILNNLPVGDYKITLSAAGYKSREKAFSIETNKTTDLDIRLEKSGSRPTSTDQSGGKIAFTSLRDGNCEIYIMNIDGSKQTRLTSNSAEDFVSGWSPDGKKIAFTSLRDGNWEIYIMNADGTGQSRLTFNSAADFVSDWSPDGQRIAFTSDRDGNMEIYIMKTDGFGQIRLTHNESFNMSPAWSPDGKRIAFNSHYSFTEGNAEIYIMNADGSGQTRLTHNDAKDFQPAWSPDGKNIAFVSNRDGNNEIYIMNTDGSSQTRLTRNSVSNDNMPSWSPDSREIAFASNRVANYEIYIMNKDGSNQTRLTHNDADDISPAWSPVGK